jgi:hypothetical protein
MHREFLKQLSLHPPIQEGEVLLVHSSSSSIISQGSLGQLSTMVGQRQEVALVALAQSRVTRRNQL